MHQPCKNKLGCICNLCLAVAMDEWMAETDDPAVAEILNEIVADDFTTQDIVDHIKRKVKG